MTQILDVRLKRKIPNSMIVSDLVEEGSWPNKNAFKENQTSQRTEQALQGDKMLPKKNQLALNKTSKALHRSQNAFPNIRCQSSLKICNSGIGCQLKFHGSDISFMTQISVSWLRQDFGQRSMLMSNFRSRINPCKCYGSPLQSALSDLKQTYHQNNKIELHLNEG